MKPQLRIVTGAHAGFTKVYSKPSITLGRHHDSDLRFHAEQDLDVSARHAAILRKGNRWFVRDQGSRNGTFVNGHRIGSDVALDDTDQIGLGAQGPLVEVRLVPESTPDGIAANTAGGHAAPQPAVAHTARITTESGPPRPSTTQRIRIEVGRQTRKLRTVIAALFIILVSVAAGLIYRNLQQSKRQAAEVAAIQARTDSILREADVAMNALRGQVEGLSTRFRESQHDVTRLQRELDVAQRSGSSRQVETLKQQLAAAMQNLQYQQVAAQVDYTGIAERNQHAVALIWVEFRRGEVYNGTAFAVRSNGILLTNKHVVAGEAGTLRPTRIAVRFADSDQTWNGRVVALSPDADLAAIKIEVRGGVPTVQGLNARPDTLHQGDPVALIGFPLGTDLPMTGGRARTSLFAGSLSKSLTDVLQIDGYGAAGASGSPILDRNGQVVGILYGGEAASHGRVLYGVPANFAVRLLESLN